MPAYPAEESEVMQFTERVAEAQRFAKKELKDFEEKKRAGGKNNKKRKSGAAADEFDDSANFVGVRDRVKNGGGGGKNKKRKLDEDFDGDIDAEDSFDVNDYTLYGRDKNFGDIATSWFTTDRDGSEAHISDLDGNYLYYTATLCNSDHTSVHEPCDLSSLPRGRKYMWRVTGALNPDKDYVAYSFCGVKASYSTELIFEITCDGDCVPLRLRNLGDVCENDDRYVQDEDEESAPVQEAPSDDSCEHVDPLTGRTRRFCVHTLVTLEGSVQLETPSSSSHLSESQQQLIGEVLRDEVLQARRRHRGTAVGPAQQSSRDAVLENVSILGTSRLADQAEASADSSAHGRQLGWSRMSVHEVRFRFMLRAEEYGALGPGPADSAVRHLTAGLADFLQHSMRSGLFRAKLLSRGLPGVASTRLHALEAVDISRRGVGVRAVEGLEEGSALVYVVLGAAVLLGVSAVVLLLRTRTKPRWSPDAVPWTESSVHGGTSSSSRIGSYWSDTSVNQSQSAVAWTTLHSSLRPGDSLGLEDAKFRLL